MSDDYMTLDMSLILFRLLMPQAFEQLQAQLAAKQTELDTSKATILSLLEGGGCHRENAPPEPLAHSVASSCLGAATSGRPSDLFVRHSNFHCKHFCALQARLIWTKRRTCIQLAPEVSLGCAVMLILEPTATSSLAGACFAVWLRCRIAPS